MQKSHPDEACRQSLVQTYNPPSHWTTATSLPVAIFLHVPTAHAHGLGWLKASPSCPGPWLALPDLRNLSRLADLAVQSQGLLCCAVEEGDTALPVCVTGKEDLGGQRCAGTPGCSIVGRGLCVCLVLLAPLGKQGR